MSKARQRVRAYHAKAGFGPAHRLRRYRVPIIAGWLVLLTLIAWLLLGGRLHAPAVARVTPANAPQHTAQAAQPGSRNGAVTLPADDAPHANTTEWWYYSGQLQSETGERYAFHVATFLLQGALAHTAFHSSLRDYQTDKHYTHQARTEGKPGEERRDGYSFNYAPWQIEAAGPQHTVKAGGKGFAIDLALTDRLSPVIHRVPGTPTAGLLDLGPAGWSYYTSRPRMSAQGTLVVDGVTRKVSGDVWFDHQWGDFDASTLRWNWFALQLADGADLMIYELFARDGAPLLRFGSYAKDGEVSALGAADFKTAARGNWRSKVSGVSYPMEWTIAVPARAIDVKLDPINRQSQFDARLTTLNVYWEGAVKVGGSHSGIGFQELYGYPAASASPKK